MLRNMQLWVNASHNLPRPKGQAPRFANDEGSHVRHGFGPAEYVDARGRNSEAREAHGVLTALMENDPARPGTSDQRQAGWDTRDKEMLALFRDTDDELSFYSGGWDRADSGKRPKHY